MNELIMSARKLLLIVAALAVGPPVSGQKCAPMDYEVSVWDEDEDGLFEWNSFYVGLYGSFIKAALRGNSILAGENDNSASLAIMAVTVRHYKNGLETVYVEVSKPLWDPDLQRARRASIWTMNGNNAGIRYKDTYGHIIHFASSFVREYLKHEGVCTSRLPQKSGGGPYAHRTAAASSSTSAT